MPVQAAADGALVLAATDQEPDGVGVGFAAEPVIDRSDVEVELPTYSGWNVPVLSRAAK